MESFYFLIPIALIFVAIALRFLFWAIHSGQYDNLDTEAHRILFDEDKPKKTGPGEPTPPTDPAHVASESKVTQPTSRQAEPPHD